LDERILRMLSRNVMMWRRRREEEEVVGEKSAPV
jgi:hypothetical protein